MFNQIMMNETIIRLGFFGGILLVVGGWEVFYERRQLTQNKALRWTSNLGLVALNSLLLKLVLPMTAVGAAFYVQANQWGLFNIIEINVAFKVILSVIILDFVIYAQHVVFHRIPVLWQLHRMHHIDLDIDVTTGIRFHPIEIIASMLIKIGVVTLLGVPPLGVVVFEILLNGTAMFNHGNIYIPEKIDRWIRLILVTPDMHRVHHSVYPNETHSNFGFNLPWWDRLFKTYRNQPKDGHLDMAIGLPIFRDPKYLGLGWLLLIPFITDSSQDVSQNVD